LALSFAEKAVSLVAGPSIFVLVVWTSPRRTCCPLCDVTPARWRHWSTAVWPTTALTTARPTVASWPSSRSKVGAQHTVNYTLCSN